MIKVGRKVCEVLQPSERKTICAVSSENISTGVVKLKLSPVLLLFEQKYTLFSVGLLQICARGHEQVQ